MNPVTDSYGTVQLPSGSELPAKRFTFIGELYLHDMDVRDWTFIQAGYPLYDFTNHNRRAGDCSPLPWSDTRYPPAKAFELPPRAPATAEMFARQTIGAAASDTLMREGSRLPLGQLLHQLQNRDEIHQLMREAAYQVLRDRADAGRRYTPQVLLERVSRLVSGMLISRMLSGSAQNRDALSCRDLWWYMNTMTDPNVADGPSTLGKPASGRGGTSFWDHTHKLYLTRKTTPRLAVVTFERSALPYELSNIAALRETRSQSTSYALTIGFAREYTTSILYDVQTHNAIDRMMASSRYARTGATEVLRDLRRSIL